MVELHLQMYLLRKLSVLLTILVCILQAQGADKYNDENRPYEFGFNIEGEQHRHEKKGEQGLIMGDFGFITADGVYHVTVYVTDENGNFKILSMKNIHTKPYPTAPERNSFSFPTSEQKPVTQGPKEIILEEPARSCSHCSIPTTKVPELTDIAIVSQDNSAFIQPEYQQPQYPENYPLYSPETYLQYPPEIYPGQPLTKKNYPEQPQDSPKEPAQPHYIERIPKQYDDVPSKFQLGQDPKQPVLISAQMQIVDKNTDIYAKFPGESEGLPNGLKKNYLQVLLYTFNYTVGFHGHYEEGYINGYKKGYYFVTGRNGARTRVDYEADDKGFRPTISQEVLDLISEEVPKEVTEKDPKYGLLGYEFKWLYYPAESNKQ